MYKHSVQPEILKEDLSIDLYLNPHDVDKIIEQAEFIQRNRLEIMNFVNIMHGKVFIYKATDKNGGDVYFYVVKNMNTGRYQWLQYCARGETGWIAYGYIYFISPTAPLLIESSDFM